MSTKPDPYSSEAETQALLAPDTRTEAERKLDKMMDELGAWEQGAEPYPLLRHIALELLKKQLAEQPAQQEPVATKLETQQFGCFHVSAEDFQRLKNLPVGTKLYTRPQTREPEQCTWTQVDDEHMPDTWQADCGAMWTFTDGGPKDNDMHYCPKCGKPTIEAAHNIKGDA